MPKIKTKRFLPIFVWLPSTVRWPICVFAPIDVKLPITELGPMTTFGPMLMNEFNCTDGSTDDDGWIFWNKRFWNAQAIHHVWIKINCLDLLTCPKSGPLKFGIGIIGRIGICIFGICMFGIGGNRNIGLNANEFEGNNNNNNVVETHKTTFGVNMLTNFWLFITQWQSDDWHWRNALDTL